MNKVTSDQVEILDLQRKLWVKATNEHAPVKRSHMVRIRIMPQEWDMITDVVNSHQTQHESASEFIRAAINHYLKTLKKQGLTVTPSSH